MQRPESVTSSSSPAVSPNDALRAMPPDAPVVTYMAGLLAITARHSTLGDVLRAVAEPTRADIEVPAQAGEIVAVEMGPGLARDVLYALLSGSQFNYILIGSISDPTALTRVVLWSRPPAEKATQTTVAINTPQPDSWAAVDAAQSDADSTMPIRAQQDMLLHRKQAILELFQGKAQN